MFSFNYLNDNFFLDFMIVAFFEAIKDLIVKKVY